RLFRSVEHHLLPAREELRLDGRTHGDTQLASSGEDVDRVVAVASEEDAEARWWLGQLVDLVAQTQDLVARLSQRLGQALVLAGHAGQRPLRFLGPLLGAARTVRRQRESAS